MPVWSPTWFGSAGGAGGYSISNSVIFDRGSSDFLSRTPDASNRDTWTFSTWFKLGDAGSNEFGLFSGGADINNSSRLVLDASRNLKYQHFDSGKVQLIMLERLKFFVTLQLGIM